MRATTTGDVNEDDRLAGLSPSQMKALVALLSGSTQAEAASTAGVTRQQIAYWIHHDLVFKVNLKLEKLAFLRAARAGLASGALEAVNYLRSTLMDPSADANQKLKAASLLLDSSGLDQAPAPWPVLNDVELVVAAELAHTSTGASRAHRDAERKELEMKNHAALDPTAHKHLAKQDVRIALELDKVQSKLRKLTGQRRLTERQTAQKEALEVRLGELNLEAKQVALQTHRLELKSTDLNDLRVDGAPLMFSPDQHPAFLDALRREAELDG
jgi:hypothetical protein